MPTWTANTEKNFSLLRPEKRTFFYQKTVSEPTAYHKLHMHTIIYCTAWLEKPAPSGFRSFSVLFLNSLWKSQTVCILA